MQTSLEIDVFIYRKSQDTHFAKEIYDFLLGHGLKDFNTDLTLAKIPYTYNVTSFVVNAILPAKIRGKMNLICNILCNTTSNIL